MLAQTQTIVQYDRRSRTWQSCRDTVVAFPRGPEGKRAAQLDALEHDRPDLYHVVSWIAQANDDNPKLVDRLLKACQLIVAGHVFNGGKVRSQSEESITYRVDWGGFPKSYTCGCVDFDLGLQRLAGRTKFGGVDVDFQTVPVCKHILSQHIAYIAGVPLEDEPIPFGQ